MTKNVVTLIRSRNFFLLKPSIHEGGTIVSIIRNGDASMSSIRNAGAIVASGEKNATPQRMGGFRIIFQVLFLFDTPLRQTCKPSLVNLSHFKLECPAFSSRLIGRCPSSSAKGRLLSCGAYTKVCVFPVAFATRACASASNARKSFPSGEEPFMEGEALFVRTVRDVTSLCRLRG